MLVERDPHQLVEGIVIAAYAIQCNLAFVYLRGEFALGTSASTQAIDDAYAAGLPRQEHPRLGLRPRDRRAPRRGRVHLRRGDRAARDRSRASAACRGSSRRLPAIEGLYAKPTVVNNVETLSTVPHIIAMGGEEYAELGVNRSTGTRIFSVSGHVKQPGQLRGRARHQRSAT